MLLIVETEICTKAEKGAKGTAPFHFQRLVA